MNKANDGVIYATCAEELIDICCPDLLDRFIACLLQDSVGCKEDAAIWNGTRLIAVIRDDKLTRFDC